MDGDSVCLDEHGLHLEGRVSDEYLMVDVRGAEVSKELVKERISLGGEGFILVKVVIDGKRRKLLERPFAMTLGWVEAEDKEESLNEIIEEVVKKYENKKINTNINENPKINIRPNSIKR